MTLYAMHSSHIFFFDKPSLKRLEIGIYSISGETKNKKMSSIEWHHFSDLG